MDDFDDQIKQTTKNPWYAVRTFNCQELKISDFLKEKKKVHFVPMTYVVENPLKVVPLIHSNLTPVKFSHSPFCLFLFSSYSSCPLCRVLH